MEENRKELEERLIYTMAAVLTKEQHDEFKKLLSQMDDKEFFGMVEYARSKAKNDASLKDVLNINQELMMTKSQDFLKEMGYNNIKTEFLSDDENKKVWDKTKSSKPTDLIDLNKESVDSLIELISFDKNKLSGIPSDILFLDTVPLPDVMVKCKFSNGIENFRVVIYPDYKQCIDNSDDNHPAKVGAIIIDIDNSKIFMEIEVLKGFDYIITSNIVGYYKLPINVREFIINKLSAGDFLKSFSENLTIWYGIQIALINPIIKNVFVKNTTTDVLKEERNVKKGKSKKKIKYIKRHVLNADDINRRHNSHYERKTLSWYVIGHWRTYKNGKRIFIKPYWKGILRDSKKYNDSDNIRKRDVVIPDKID